MDRGEIVVKGWDLVQANKRLWGIAAFVLLSGAVIRLVLPGDTDFFWMIVNNGISLLFTAFLNGALICMIVARLENRTLTVMEGFRAGWHWLLPLFVLSFLLQIPMWGMLFVAQGSLTVDPRALLESLSLQAKMLILGVMLSLLIDLLCSAILVGAERAVVLEGRSIGRALQRGWQLLWDHLGDYWGIGIRLFVIVLGIGLAFAGLSCVWTAFGSIIPDGVPSGLLSIISALGLAIVSSLLVPFGMATWTLAFRQWQAQERSDLAATSKLGSS